MLERREKERERENVYWDKPRAYKLITIVCKDALSRGVFIKRIQRRVLLASLLLNRHISPRGGRCINRAPRVILFFSTSQRNPLVSCFCLCNEGLRGLILPRLRVPLACRRLNGEFVVLRDEIYTGQTVNYVFSSLKLPLNHPAPCRNNTRCR